MNFYLILSIATGGALGAVSRYMINTAFTASGVSLPLATLTANIVGSFLMGMIISYLAHFDNHLSQEIKAMIITGFLGALTTFSTFSLDAITMIERQEYLYASLYILASVVICLLSVFGGMILARSMT